MLVGHLRAVLEAENIGVLVKNEHLTGGIGDLPAIEQCLAGIPSCIIGRFNETGDLTCTDCARSIDALRTTWSNTIRW